MKLTAILLLIGTLHLSAASFSQSVTISRKNATLETIFKDIKQQTGYLFFYTGKVKASDQRLNVELKNVPLNEALKICLQNDNLNFTIVNKTIVLSPKSADNVSETNVKAVTLLTVTGKVVDKDNNEGIPGVNISIKNNAAKRAQTNSDGNFKIEAQPGDILVFTYIGYKSKEVKITDTKELNIVLEAEVNAMKDVVITGYQTIKKETYTGNAITISGTDLKRTNPQNLLKSIQTFDPSFRVLDNNLLGSDPNAMPKINVRGATALPNLPNTADDVLDRNNLSSSYNLPTFILDGFEVSAQKVVDLDINRIESVTLLKDAAATAVYGSRAANGVMVITTKAPVAGKLQLNYNYELQFSAPDLSGYHVLNAKQKLEYEVLSKLYVSGENTGNAKQDVLDQDYFDRLKNVASGVNTYWLAQPLRNSFGNKHSLNVQGGDQTFRYGVDFRYQTQPGVMKGSNRDRYSGGMNFTYNPNPKLILRNEVTINQTNAVNSPYGDFSTYVSMNPYYPMKDPSGNYIQELAEYKVSTGKQGADQFRSLYVFNPLYEANLHSFNKAGYLELIDAFSADYKLSPSFRLRALMSLNKTTNTTDVFVSPFSRNFYTFASADLNKRGTYDYSSENSLGLDGNITLNYNKQIGDHSVNMVMGANVLSAKADYRFISAQGFSNDRFTNVGFARIYKENAAPASSVNERRTAGAFVSGNYAFQNKYLLDFSFRMEGSSTFGSDKRFAPFWSVGTGWNIHRESFLEDNSTISLLRLKASTGVLGSISFPAYQSRSMYQYHPADWYSTGVGATIIGYGNSNLEWQKTTSYDVGMDIGLFADRIMINPRYYYKLTKGLITDINLAPSTGFSTYKENLGDMSNEGYELYLQANVYRNKDFNINLTGNLSHNQNKLVKISNSLKAFNQKIDDLQNNADNNLFSMPILRYVEGQSTNAIYAVRSLGIDPQNGREIYVKKDGSLSYDWDVKDMMPVGDTSPKFEGNFGSSISFKRFMLSFNLAYRFGGDLYNQTLIDRVENADPRFNVDSRALEQRWIKPGDISFYKDIANLTPTRTSSRFVQRENYVELQSVYLSYDLDKKLIKRAGMQTLRAAVTMNDIFRSSSIEIERGTVYPFARSITFSLQASF